VEKTRLSTLLLWCRIRSTGVDSGKS